jgi:hypothetical protein
MVYLDRHYRRMADEYRLLLRNFSCVAASSNVAPRATARPDVTESRAPIQVLEELSSS